MEELRFIEEKGSSEIIYLSFHGSGIFLRLGYPEASSETRILCK